MLTDVEMEDMVIKEEEEKAKKFTKWLKSYRKKKNAREFALLPKWQQADKKMTSAASIKVRYQGLLNKDLNSEKHGRIPIAVEPLKQKGERLLQESWELLEKCSAEEKELFWASQERNRDSVNFDSLVTKKDFDNAKRATAIASGMGFVDEDDSSDDDMEVESLQVETDQVPVSQEVLVDEQVSSLTSEEQTPVIVEEVLLPDVVVEEQLPLVPSQQETQETILNESE